jgi:hypothetical protein
MFPGTLTGPSQLSSVSFLFDVGIAILYLKSKGREVETPSSKKKEAEEAFLPRDHTNAMSDGVSTWRHLRNLTGDALNISP